MKQNDITDKSIEKLAAQNIENLFNVYDDNGVYFYNILRTINFPDDVLANLYYTYVTNPGDTWPLISWNAYKDVKLWWIVCSLNNIQNPVAQPVAGTVLKILNPDIVREVLMEIKGA